MKSSICLFLPILSGSSTRFHPTIRGEKRLYKFGLQKAELSDDLEIKKYKVKRVICLDSSTSWAWKVCWRVAVPPGHIVLGTMRRRRGQPAECLRTLSDGMTPSSCILRPERQLHQPTHFVSRQGRGSPEKETQAWLFWHRRNRLA